MSRIKRGTIHLKTRRSLHKATKGFILGRKKLVKVAKQALTKAGAHAYRDRKKKEQDNRRLWNIKINAICREHGLTYAKLIHKLTVHKVALNRKTLADLAEHHPHTFKQILGAIQS